MSINRRRFLDITAKLGIASMASGTLALPSSANAAAAGAKASWQVGDFTVTALLDGVVEVDEAIFSGADQEARQRLLAAAGQPAGKIRLDVNAFLVQRADSTILFDAGTRDLYGPTLGKVPDALARLGVAPGMIDHVVLTHMHNDHVGGLVDGAGRAVFGNALLHVSSAEWDYWTSEDAFGKASGQGRFSFAGARAAAPAYRERLSTFTGAREILPGIFPVPLLGHSPAHSGFRLVSGSQQMIIWGDAVVSPELQFAHPEWSSSFDADQQMATATRKRLFDEVATDRIAVAGMHLSFPGAGYVTVDGAAYRLEVDG